MDQGENKDAISDDDDESLIIDSADEESQPENDNENPDFKPSDNPCTWGIPEKDCALSEFIPLEEDLGISMENRNTQRKTDTDIRILIAYLRSLNETRSPECIPPVDLDRCLSNFFSIVKKHDGNEYEPASLRGMLCSVERYLKMKNYEASVTRDVVFVNTRHALKFKQQRLREVGKGSKKPSEPFGKLTLDKVNQLFSAHEMGPYTPMSIINTLCFMFIVHFRLRKAIDHKNLTWGDVKLRSDQSGKEYLLFDSSTSTSDTNHKPDVQNRSQSGKLCIWAQPEVPVRDPVGIYRIYRDKRPPNMKHESSPFYLGITTLHPSPMQAWYRTCAMGVNKLSDLVRMIRNITGLPRASLNAPAESLLSESYLVSKSSNPVNRIVPMPYQLPSSYVFPSTGPVISPTKALNATLPQSLGHTSFSPEENSSLNQVSETQIPTQEDSKSEIILNQFTSKTVDIPKDLSMNEFQPLQDNSDVTNFTHESRTSSSNTSSLTNCSSPEKNDAFNLSVPEVKTKILNIIKKMEAGCTGEFERWLHTLRVTRNHQTGEVECHQLYTEDALVGTRQETPIQSPQTCITLNINLSPTAMKGQGPLTVSATTRLNPEPNSSEEVAKQTDSKQGGTETNTLFRESACVKELEKDYNTNKKTKHYLQQNDDDHRQSEECYPRKRKALSESEIHEHSMNKHSKSSIVSSVVNLSNKHSNGAGSTLPSQVPIESSMPSSGCVMQSSSSTSVSGPSMTSHVAPSRRTSLTDHSLGNTMIPQAHCSMSHRFTNSDGRDLGLIVPVPLPYAGQAGLANRMVQNSAMFASLTAPPISAAHAGFLHQSLLHSIHASGNLSDLSAEHLANNQKFLREHNTNTIPNDAGN